MTSYAEEQQRNFELYDLKVTVKKHPDRSMACGHSEGAFFLVQGEMLVFPEGGGFPFYSLSSILPVLAAKQRETHRFDWMSTDNIIACPDPLCGGLFEIQRLDKRTFNFHEVTQTQWKDK